MTLTHANCTSPTKIVDVPTQVEVAKAKFVQGYH
jgi:hypothetical protein